MPRTPLPEWMIELAEQVKMIEPGVLLPTGVIVGSAVIEKCEAAEQSSVVSGQSSAKNLLPTDHSPLTTVYKWHLADVRRASRLRKPKRHPQPVWFRPF